MGPGRRLAWIVPVSLVALIVPDRSHAQEAPVCPVTITLNPSQIQTVCPSRLHQPAPPDTEKLGRQVSALARALDDLRAEHETLRSEFTELEEETKSWREIIEWPRLDRVFAPDNDTLYVDPEGRVYKDCQAALARTNKQGIYVLNPGSDDDELSFLAYCDPEGWTVIQRRFDGSEDFYRDWDDYMSGFGRLGGEFWLGLENIYRLTNQRDSYTLRLEALGYNNKLYVSENPNFHLKPETDEYEIVVGNKTAGNYKDLLSELNGTRFTTRDRDNDDWNRDNCALQHRGAFWLKDCGWDINRQYCDGQGCMRYGDRTIKKSLLKMKIKAGAGTNAGGLRTPKKGKKQRKPRRQYKQLESWRPQGRMG